MIPQYKNTPLLVKALHFKAYWRQYIREISCKSNVIQIKQLICSIVDAICGDSIKFLVEAMCKIFPES